MLSIALWRATPTILASVVAIVLVLVAAAPWLPWLDVRLFGWLEKSAVPWMREQRWAWSVLFLLVLLPPLEALIRLLGLAFKRFRSLRLTRAVLRAATLGAGAPVPAVAPVPPVPPAAAVPAVPAVPGQADGAPAAAAVTTGTGRRPG
jgi:hypothetical protein